MKIKTIIVEDEKNNREVLANFIGQYCPDIEIAEQCASFQEGLLAIREKKPSLVFMDIRLSDGNGIDLLDIAGKSDFEIIFTTAYQEYAVDVINKFGNRVSQYILKPISIKQLVQAVENAKGNIERKSENIFGTLSKDNILIPLEEGVRILKRNEVVFIAAEGAYSKIILQNAKPIVLARNLSKFKYLEEDPDFMRIHNSHIINMQHVKMYMRGSGGSVVMSDGTRLPVSRNKKLPFLDRLGEA